MNPIDRYSQDALSGRLGGGTQEGTQGGTHSGGFRHEGDLDQAAEEFRQAMGQGGHSPHDAEGHADHHAGSNEEPSSGLPTPWSPLGAFGFTPAYSIAPREGAESLESIGGEIVDRLLVSDPSFSEKQEVRMQLKESVLPGTEVRLTREGGEVRVTFVTTAQESASLLAGHRQNLQVLLEQKFPGERIFVEIREEESEHGDNEGRSRNRREYETPEENQS